MLARIQPDYGYTDFAKVTWGFNTELLNLQLRTLVGIEHTKLSIISYVPVALTSATSALTSSTLQLRYKHIYLWRGTCLECFKYNIH